MNFDELKALFDEFNLADFLPDVDTVLGWVETLLRLAVMAGPIILLGFGLLYLFHIMDEADLMMLSVFYFLCDYICILIHCPFQFWIMKNRCCVNCRIFDWGHFMMFTPMLFIRNFYSWSLFFTSAIVLLKWEIVYAKHPERFWYGSNKHLQCANCNDKICQVKKKVTKAVTGKK